ncbi:hypothetical protein [Granulicella tundricola]|uniref:Uncharacterized protein n=1 Tax=Granulicella tundricola (strain ATCC BAA-1859 / DSM 23138 / MP5ACTX9) TaxID=1198114 RepID=E8WX33_GRATM|nr:hypothetical protein [Granulicella tundricola]ADW68594.1 hypothetical protein AciX9_1541 [Granulicella tundricola MP5ACTX9]
MGVYAPILSSMYEIDKDGNLRDPKGAEYFPRGSFTFYTAPTPPNGTPAHYPTTGFAGLIEIQIVPGLQVFNPVIPGLPNTTVLSPRELNNAGVAMFVVGVFYTPPKKPAQPPHH